MKWFVLIGYVHLCPFTSLFAISPILILPGIFLAAMFPLLFIANRLDLRYFLPGDMLLPVVFLLGVMAMAWAPVLGEKNLNHALAFLACQVFFYWLVLLLVMPGAKWTTISNAIVACGAIAGAFIIVEWFVSNYYSIVVSEILPYAHEEIADATFMGAYIRPRGYAVEGGHMAILFELVIPFAVLGWGLRIGKMWKWLVLWVIIISFLLLASAAAIASLLMAFAIYLALHGRLRASFAAVFLMAAVAAVFFTSDSGADYYDAFLGRKLEYFVGLFGGAPLDVSARDRSDALIQGVGVLSDYPMGRGWGTGSQLAFDGLGSVGQGGGLLNLYAEIAVASGCIGLLLFLWWIMRRVRAVAQSSHEMSGPVLVATLAISMHYFFVANYWYPLYWLVMALAAKLIVEDRISRSVTRSSVGDLPVPSLGGRVREA